MTLFLLSLQINRPIVLVLHPVGPRQTDREQIEDWSAQCRINLALWMERITVLFHGKRLYVWSWIQLLISYSFWEILVLFFFFYHCPFPVRQNTWCSLILNLFLPGASCTEPGCISPKESNQCHFSFGFGFHHTFGLMKLHSTSWLRLCCNRFGRISRNFGSRCSYSSVTDLFKGCLIYSVERVDRKSQQCLQQLFKSHLACWQR